MIQMKKNSHNSMKQNDLRKGAECVRSNFIQSSQDQLDLINLANHQEDSIYQVTKTVKNNSSHRENTQNEDKYDNWLDLDSFIPKLQSQSKQEEEHNVQSVTPSQHNNLNKQQYNHNNNRDNSQVYEITKSQINFEIQNENSNDLTFEINKEEIIFNEANKIKTFYHEDSIKVNKEQHKLDSLSQKQESLLPLELDNSQILDHSLIRIQCQKQIPLYQFDQSSKGLTGSWKKKSLIIITKIKQFILQMKKNSNTLKFQQINQKQFRLINDCSADFKFYYMTKQMKSTPSKYKQLTYHLTLNVNLYLQNKENLRYLIEIFKSGVIQPHSKKKIIWELLFFISILWQIFYIPFFISFSQPDTNSIKDINFLKTLLRFQIPIILYADILFNFCSAYYSKGKLIVSRKQIFNHYIKKVATAFFVNMSLKISGLNYLIFLKILRLSAIYNNFEERVNLRYKYSSIIDLCNLAFNILFIAHICGCCFFLVAIIERSYEIEQTWIDFYNLSSKSVTEQYITSVYWAVITMITLGYGDYVPKTYQEKIFVIIITLISCGVFAYCVNQIGSIITKITKKRSQFQQKIAQISGYLQERGIKSDLLMKIKQNFAYLQRESEKDMEVHKVIESQLSRSLRKEVFREMYIQVLQSCKSFKLNFSEPFLLKLAPLLREKKFAPEEIIYESRQKNLNLYFIMRGQVSLFFNLGGEKRQIKLVQKDEVFGEQSFFSQNVSDHSAIALNVANVVYVNLSDFISVIKLFPADFETYCMMKDKLNLFSTSKRLGLKCYGCGQFQHFTKDCPFINYLPSKEKILFNYNVEVKQERDPSFILRRVSFNKPENSIIRQKNIQEEVINFLIEKNFYENIFELLEILKNQNICIETLNQTSEYKEQETHEKTEKPYCSSLTQKSIQVLYPEMNDEYMTESSRTEIETPTKVKMLSSINQVSVQSQQQQISPQRTKIKRTKTPSTNRQESYGFLPSSQKQINNQSENSYTTQNFERVEQRKRSNINVSFLNNHLLRDSSRKIIIEEIDSQKYLENGMQTLTSLPRNSSLVSNNYNNNNNNNNNIHWKDSTNLQQQYVSFLQSSLKSSINPSLYAHNLSNNNNNNPTTQQHNPNYKTNDETNKKMFKYSRSYSESCSQKNKKIAQNISSLSPRGIQQKSDFSQNEKKQIDLHNDKLMNQLRKAAQCVNSNNVNLYQAQSQINSHFQFTWSSMEIYFERMSAYSIFFPHNNYQQVIESYIQYFKRNIEVARMDSSIIKRKKIQLLKKSILKQQGNAKSSSQNSQRNSRQKMKSFYYLQKNNDNNQNNII